MRLAGAIVFLLMQFVRLAMVLYLVSLPLQILIGASSTWIILVLGSASPVPYSLVRWRPSEVTALSVRRDAFRETRGSVASVRWFATTGPPEVIL